MIPRETVYKRISTNESHQHRLAMAATTHYPEGRVLIIMTGGTICMRSSPEGLVPARGFLEAGMRPRPSFNDGSNPGEQLVFAAALVLFLTLATMTLFCFVLLRYGCYLG